MLFPAEKKRYVAKTCYPDEDGWQYIPQYRFFNAWSLDDAIRKTRIAYFGIAEDGIRTLPVIRGNPLTIPNMAYLRVKEVKSKEWTVLYDAKIPERPVPQWIAERGTKRASVAHYGLEVLAELCRNLLEERRSLFPDWFYQYGPNWEWHDIFSPNNPPESPAI